METITQRDKFVARLLSGPCTVVFNKVDGTARRMRCTLDPKLIPEKFETKTVGRASNEENKTAIVVFDLEVGDWRSFRVDSVIDFEEFNSDPFEAVQA